MAFDAGVELATALDGVGVGVVVARSWIEPSVIDGVATATGTDVGWNVVTEVEELAAVVTVPDDVVTAGDRLLTIVLEGVAAVVDAGVGVTIATAVGFAW